ncbi:MAG TPA: rRNA maturation RNase YbeY [Gemmatimonadaceae bacterium]|nr:rRNA maturation RNase YbeY [Gemmatimonadaceae bacterium]
MKGTLSVDVSLTGTRTPLSRSAIADIARETLRREGVRSALLSITLVDRRTIARLNRRHLGHAGATDVISFAFERATRRDPVIGDIYIAPDVARANARSRGVGVRNELARLVVHGVLHVLGYDHPEGERRERSPMWRRQERLLHAAEHRTSGR